MTTWSASVGEILDVDADALICSANPQLNLSGGVGGEFSLRYGEAMQSFLHNWLRREGVRFIPPGTVVPAPSCGSAYEVVFHAVAIDAFYGTSIEWIQNAYHNALRMAAERNCRTIISACLACGYGRATPEQFVEAIRPLFDQSELNIRKIEFRSTNREIVEAIQRELDSRQIRVRE